MALSILDGNQSATTLSTIVTSGQHIPAHTVVSLGTQAITNISSAISGSTVCVGNLGLLQSTVATEGLSASGSFIKIGGHTGTSTTGNIVHVSSVGALRVDGSVYTQPVSIASVTIGNTVTIAGTVTANPTGTQTIVGTVTANVVGFNSEESFGTGVIQSISDAEKDTIRSSLWIADSSDPSGAAGNGQILSQNYPMPISGTITIGSALPAGTNRIGVVTIGGGTVTIGAGTAQIGSVTASLAYSQTATTISSTAVTAIPVVFPTSGAYGGSLQGYNGTNTYIYSGIQAIGNTSLASATSLPVSLGSLPALVASTAQIGSVTASISNSVVTFYPAQGTTVTNSNFTSTTASTTLVSAVAGREVLTVFNEGAGNLHISPGATATTISYQVRLSPGDYWECPQGQLSLAHTAVFATAGTARVTEVS